MNTPPLLGEYSQQTILTCLASIDKTFKESYIIQPTNLLREHNEATAKIAATDLTLHGENNLKQIEKYHFRKVKLDTVIKDYAALQNTTNTFLKKLATHLFDSTRPVIPAIAKCQSAIASKLSILRMGITNERELQFAVVDPITGLLSSYWNLLVSGWGTRARVFVAVFFVFF